MIALLAACFVSVLIGACGGAGIVGCLWLAAAMRRYRAARDAAFDRDLQDLLAREADR